MKKKLLMAAVGAALVAGPVVTANAAATLYGHFHMSFDRFDNDNNVENGSLANNSSRFGIKGNEDLGGGLKAIYQVESGIFNPDEGSGGFGATLRNSFIGFTGGWGTVKVGRHDTPYKDLGRKMDSFNEEIGDLRNVIGNAGGAGSAFDNRVSNMIRYESPKFAGGWAAVVQHTSNNGSDVATNTAQKDNSVGITWSAGPIFLGLAWDEVGTTTNTDPAGIRLAGTYTFNDLTLGLLWESLSDVGGVSGADRDGLGVIASYKMGNNKLKFHWFEADEFDNAPNTGGSILAIGVDHQLSKTTKVYVNYAKADNDSVVSNFNVASGPGGHDAVAPAAGLGTSPTAFSVGMVLNF